MSDSLYINKFNQVFEQNLPEEGRIDANTDMPPVRILKLLKKEVPLCKYCFEVEKTLSIALI